MRFEKSARASGSRSCHMNAEPPESSALSDELWAHSESPDGQPQLLVDHLRNVARRASEAAEKFESGRVGEWLGWYHDLGKVHPAWQAYVRDADEHETGPDHSSVGMLAARQIDAALFAFSLAGHHGGLVDREQLRDRIARKKEEPRIVEALQCGRSLLDAETVQLPDLTEDDVSPFPQKGESGRLRYEFWVRMLHSTLVDADSLDTEEHFDPEEARLRSVPDPVSIGQLWRALHQHVQELIAGSEGIVNEMRAKVYRACIQEASRPQGVFSLTVPTGGGKTLSSMGFGLRHAMEHDLDRVIVVLPYTSIIDQNAAVYRKIFGDEAVLEHHSSVTYEAMAGEESYRERWQRLASENWDVPVVVTTSVQFLESLFSHRNGRCRKLHNVCRSVVILDEVQTLPAELLLSTMNVLQHLVDHYAVTLVLSTATQPALQSREGFQGLRAIEEIIPDAQALFESLERVEYETDLQDAWPWSRVAEEMASCDQSLTIVNTIGDATALLEAMDDPDAFHLSTRLCGAHRKEVLKEIETRLDDGDPVRLVSTQVIEAGVDIDFPLVLRALGPLDRILQAAGRCNREGHQDRGRVVVFRPEDGTQPPGAYKTGSDVTRVMFSRADGLQLHDPDVPDRYFRKLYGSRNLDERRIQDNRIQFKFETVGQAYRLINEESVSVVVPYHHDELGDPSAAIDRIQRTGFATRRDFRALQPFVVNVRPFALKDSAALGFCREVVPGLWLWTCEERYHPVRGLRLDLPAGKDLIA